MKNFDNFEQQFTPDCIPYGINAPAAQELYQFITTNLDVNNETPAVEDLMLWLEETFNLCPE